MAIKVKAVERQLKVGKDAGSYRFMLQAEIYNTLTAQKVISEAAVSTQRYPRRSTQCCMGRHRTGSKGVGHRRSLHRHPWTGSYAIRCSCHHGG